jgi:hypothetical protein
MTAWRWATLGAVLTIAVGSLFGLVPGIDACGPATGAGQWATFQTIRSVADVQAMIRADCAAAFVPALRMSMALDALAFIPAFTLLLASALIALKPPRWLLLTGLMALAGGFIADQLEGVRLLAILNDLPGTSGGVQAVVFAHIVKKFMLALATGLVGVALLQIAGWRRWVGFIVLLGALAAMANTIASFAGGESGLLVSWLALAVVAVAGAMAERRHARSPAPGSR